MSSFEDLLFFFYLYKASILHGSTIKAIKSRLQHFYNILELWPCLPLPHFKQIMTTEGSSENESRYRNLIQSILMERLLFRNPGRFAPSNKTFRHQDLSDLDVSAPKKLRYYLVLSQK